MERFARTRQKTERARALRRGATRSERKLWPYLRGAQLGVPFRRQHPIGPYFADYCCVPLQLVVEIDGPWHDAQKDAARDRYLQDRGFDVMRFGLEAMDENLTGVVDAITSAVRDRLAASPPSNSPLAGGRAALSAEKETPPPERGRLGEGLAV